MRWASPSRDMSGTAHLSKVDSAHFLEKSKRNSTRNAPQRRRREGTGGGGGGGGGRGRLAAGGRPMVSTMTGMLCRASATRPKTADSRPRHNRARGARALHCMHPSILGRVVLVVPDDGHGRRALPSPLCSLRQVFLVVVGGQTPSQARPKACLLSPSPALSTPPG